MMVGAYMHFFFLNQFITLSGGLNAWVFLLAFIGSVIFAVLFGIIRQKDNNSGPPGRA